MATARLTSVLRWYSSMRHRYPLRSAAITSFCVFSLGDGLAQTVIERKTLRTYDFGRTLRMSTVGALWNGPTLSLWYTWLATGAGAAVFRRNMVYRIFIDQAIFGPLVQLPGFFIGNGLLEGLTFTQIKDRMVQRYPQIVTVGAFYWPIVQFFNFRFMPTEFQLIFGQAFAVVWNGFLSWRVLGAGKTSTSISTEEEAMANKGVLPEAAIR